MPTMISAMKYRYPALGLIAFAVVSGCSPVLRSERLGGGMAASTHVSDYQLARVLLPVMLKKSGEAYALEIGEPRAAGDPSAAYVFRYEGSPFAADEFTIEVDSKTRLLKKIQLKTEEKTDAIIVKAAESLALLESAPAAPPEEEVLVSVEIDPSDDNEVASLRTILVRSSDGQVSDFNITPVAATEPLGTGTDADCSVGFCYRVPIPYRVDFAFATGRRFEKEIGLPNGGPVIAVPLTRAAFVEKVTNVTFVDGTPSEIELKKPSEALDLVSVPVEVAKAIVRVPAELVKLRVDLSDQEKKLAETEKARIEAERELERTRSETALESSPLRVRKVFMFGSSGGWTGPRLPQTLSPTPAPRLREDVGNGELEPIGGSEGTG